MHKNNAYQFVIECFAPYQWLAPWVTVIQNKNIRFAVLFNGQRDGPEPCRL